MEESKLAIREQALVAPNVQTLTREQIELIKHTVAVGATDNELKLFLYQANKRGLDPLTRQIHFIKRRQYNPDTEKYDDVGTIQTGIDGFRVIADRTGKLSGIKRGVVKDEKGKLTGAWAEVYRSDWTQPAREEVSLDEYCQRKKDGSPVRLWATMPETMIKKVAEAAALRMAFPEDLSGIYSHEEMQQADTEVVPISDKRKMVAQAEQDKRDYWPESTIPKNEPQPKSSGTTEEKGSGSPESKAPTPKEQFYIELQTRNPSLKTTKNIEEFLIKKHKVDLKTLDTPEGLEKVKTDVFQMEGWK